MPSLSTTGSALLALSASLAILLVSTSALASEPQGEPTPSVEVAQDQEQCTIQTLVSGISCTLGDGEVAWETFHPSLWENSKTFYEGQDSQYEVELIEINGRVFYTLVSELLEVDTRPLSKDSNEIRQGGVIGRTVFPAPIRAIEVVDTEGGWLHITLEFSSLSGVPSTQDIRHQIDQPSPAQIPWVEGRVLYRAYQDADIALARFQKEDADPQEIATWFEEQSNLDPTNLFYALFAARQAKEMGDPLRYQRSIERLVHSEGARWSEMVQAWLWLLKLSEPDLAEEALEKALFLQEKQGIQRERIRDYILPVLLLNTPPELYFSQLAMQFKLEEDYESYHTLFDGLFRLLPAVDAFLPAKNHLVKFFEAHDQQAIAAHWQQSIDSTEAITRLDDSRLLFWATLLLLFTLFSSLVLLPAIGMRVGRERGLAREEAHSLNQAFIWPRGLRVLAVAVILLATIALPVLPLYSSTLTTLEYGHHRWKTDSYAHPEVEEFLLSLSPSPQQQRALQVVQGEAKAFNAGQPITDKPLLTETIFEAQRTHAREATKSRFFAVYTPEQGPQIPLLFAALFSPLLVIALYFGGVLLGRRRPEFVSKIFLLLPGATIKQEALSLLVLTGSLFVLATFIASFSLTEVDMIFYLGLESTSAAILPGFLLLLSILVVLFQYLRHLKEPS